MVLEAEVKDGIKIIIKTTETINKSESVCYNLNPNQTKKLLFITSLKKCLRTEVMSCGKRSLRSTWSFWISKA